MRARYVNGDDLLTPFGRLIAARLPHIERTRGHWGEGSFSFRIYGLKPLCRCCLFDLTRARIYGGRPAWTRLRLCGWTVLEVNRHLSGLPGARLDVSK